MAYKNYNIQELKEFLGEYLALKGINPNKLMRCFSPEHEDVHPSMSYSHKLGFCKCFACGEVYNIFRLVGEEYNLKTFKEQIEKVNELYNNKDLILNANESIYNRKGTSIDLENTTYNKPKEYKKKYPELAYYYRECKNHINEINYLEKRGISKEIIDKYNIGFDKNFKGFPALIIPVSFDGFTARNINENEELKYKKIGKSDFFNYHELNFENKKNEVFFIVEGEIDALSLIEVGKNAIALRSVNNIDLFIEKLKEDKPTQKFNIMLDNDERGKISQETLYYKMLEIGINVENFNLPEQYKDPNDFLIKDRKGLESFLYKRTLENIWKNKINHSFCIGD